MVSCRWEELYIWKKHILKHIGSGTHEAQLFTCKVCGWTSTGNNQPIDHCSQDHDLGENESKEKIVLKYLEIVGEEPQRPERPMKKEPVDSPENSPAPPPFMMKNYSNQYIHITVTIVNIVLVRHQNFLIREQIVTQTKCRRLGQRSGSQSHRGLSQVQFDNIAFISFLEASGIPQETIFRVPQTCPACGTYVQNQLER